MSYKAKTWHGEDRPITEVKDDRIPEMYEEELERRILTKVESIEKKLEELLKEVRGD